MRYSVTLCLFVVGSLTTGCGPEPSDTPKCGNGTIDTGEECDGSDLGQLSCPAAGKVKCNQDCKADFSGCQAASDCSNNQIDSGEDCDGTNLNNATCRSELFSGGTLACDDSCQFDTSGCCNDACPLEGNTQCNGDVIETCSVGANTCLVWSPGTDCSNDGESCVESNGTAICEPPCSHGCPLVGETQCSGEVLQTCSMGTNNCRAWLDTDCSLNNQYCDQTIAPAGCFALPQTPTLEVVGTTDTTGFMSLFEYNNKLYAGTYGQSTKVYSYPSWQEEAALHGGESVFHFGELNGDLYAITEDEGKLFKSSNGSDFSLVLTADNNLGLGLFTINGSIFANFTCFRPNTSLPCVALGKGPTLHRTSNGIDFTEVNWPPASDVSCVVYENAPQLNGRVYKNSYCSNYSITRIYSSADGIDWRLEQTFNGVISYMFSFGDSIYGLKSGSTIIKFDGVNETEVATGPVAFHGMAVFKRNLYLSTSCWENCSSNPHGSLYRFEFRNNTFTRIGQFDEQGVSKLYVYDGALYAATKSDRDVPSTHGKVYKMVE